MDSFAELHGKQLTDPPFGILRAGQKLPIYPALRKVCDRSSDAGAALPDTEDVIGTMQN